MVRGACPRPRGSLYDASRGIVYRNGCSRWSCRPCARRKSASLARRFGRIRWARQPALVTLTAGFDEDADSTFEALSRFAARVRSFRRCVAKHVGEFNWAWVREISPRDPECQCDAPHPSPGCGCLFCQWASPELVAQACRGLESDPIVGLVNRLQKLKACRCGKGGNRLHVHMLWDARYVPQRVLSEVAARCHLGHVIDVRRVSAKRSARYVSKYLTKSEFPSVTLERNGAAHRTRRFAVRAPERPKEPSGWHWDPRRPALVAVECLGCTEIDWDAEGWCAYAQPT
jgi:hypothetical protein